MGNLKVLSGRVSMETTNQVAQRKHEIIERLFKIALEIEGHPGQMEAFKILTKYLPPSTEYLKVMKDEARDGAVTINVVVETDKPKGFTIDAEEVK